MLHLGDMWPKEPPKRGAMITWFIGHLIKINPWSLLLCLVVIVIEAYTVYYITPPAIIVDTPKVAPIPEPRAMCDKKNGILESIPGDIVVCFRGWV